MKKFFAYLVSLCLLIGLTVEHRSFDSRDARSIDFEFFLYASSRHVEHSKNNIATYEIDSRPFSLSIAYVFSAFSILSKEYSNYTNQIISVQNANLLAYQSSIYNLVFLLKTITSKHQRTS